jgi:hypothetical protein
MFAFKLVILLRLAAEKDDKKSRVIYLFNYQRSN